jgi:proteic killer suppression protein
LDIPGFDFHELKGDRKGTFAVKVTANWRVTFRWDDDGQMGR